MNKPLRIQNGVIVFRSEKQKTNKRVYYWLLIFCIFIVFILAGCAGSQGKIVESEKPERYDDLKKMIVSEFATRNPADWGENITGVVTRFDTNKKVIALTFDACGGPKGSGYDRELIDYLIKEGIPATLFINARWIDANPDIFAFLSAKGLFEIENHGLLHKPCSSRGKVAYRIKGTSDLNEMVDEIELNARKIQVLTGHKPTFYRPGTANCDDICVDVAARLGYKIAGFSINGDYGATANRNQVRASLLSAKPGDIVLMHFNHPEGETFEGLLQAIPELKIMGFRFSKISDVMPNGNLSSKNISAPK